jgi:hypothetical protein
MARPAAIQSIEEVIDESVRVVVARVLPLLQRAFAATVEARIRAELPPNTRRRRTSGSRRVGQITRWVADNRARRVPTFVIESTGLDTKKKIVAKYGPNAAFEKGKPPPPVVEKNSAADRKAETKAKPPIVRKKKRAA